MIIFGRSATHVKIAESQDAICGNCQNKGTLVFDVFSTHFHVFWIPVLPIGKIGSTTCTHCRDTTTSARMPKELRNAFRAIKKDAKTPLWQYSGIGVAFLMLASLFFMGKNSNKNALAYLEKPKVGDTYRFKVDKDTFSTLKVTSVAEDSIYVVFNNHEIDKMSSIYKIEKQENYAEEQVAMSRLEVKEMYDLNTIYSVIRD